MGLEYVFPARDLSVDPRSGVTRRHHVDPSVINKAIKVAVRRAGLTKHISAHTFRHYAEFRIMPSTGLSGLSILGLAISHSA